MFYVCLQSIRSHLIKSGTAYDIIDCFIGNVLTFLAYGVFFANFCMTNCIIIDATLLTIKHLTYFFQEHVRGWLQGRLDRITSNDEDNVQQLTRMFVTLLKEVTSLLKPVTSVEELFSPVGVDYFKVASIACDAKVCLCDRV